MKHELIVVLMKHQQVIELVQVVALTIFSWLAVNERFGGTYTCAVVSFEPRPVHARARKKN